MITESAAKKDTQKLQRAIVDGLEDVKAQDIVVFNTEHLSALFERVIIATGSSNRQTKALAASVRDAVREAGFGKPRTEGEQNGEWIIVDCSAAVAHIMQPAIRQYYHLEEIWGEKPVRLKFGTDKPAVASSAPAKPEAPQKTTLRRSSAAKTAVKQREQADREAKAATSTRRAPKRVQANTATPKRAGKPPAAAKSPSKAPARPPAKAPAKTLARAPAKSAAKPAARKVIKPASKTAAPRKPSPAKK